MSLYRIPLVLLATGGFHLCLTNPNPGVPAEERKKFSGSESSNETFISRYTSIVKYGLWIGAVCETAVILAHRFPYPPLTDDVLSALIKRPNAASLICVSPRFLVGVAVTLAGTMVRYHCYRTLGRLFTYQLSFREDHQLITHGPYAIVRHPSYTAYIAAFTGLCISWFSEGSWVRESGILESGFGRGTVGALFFSGLSIVGVCVWRPIREDRALRIQFGEKWDEWARRVPYRIFPYIY
ncbi:hypothetical protein NEOLEDRAFT_1158072 [Neolentinus lepideus HHB14362 ss-1]|uniref:Protein-S-isoprenylcysteine O-methyltransferase n=1 Tax=Neolentinus lepideus HHB14362 ss-1 TaxID=1314782 RepID=A0A165Q1P8_9AGAM|nr:hypothetical protein NEOLEDRAFT_1158072 [Neolentinus lepideus HHB14362 ss-1]